MAFAPSISKKLHKRWDKELSEYGIVYLYATAGYGKTVQTEAYARDNYKKYIRISASSSNFIEEVKEFISENAKSKVRVLLILDDLQWLRDETKQKELFDLLLIVSKRSSKIRTMLLSRATMPAYLSPLQVTKQLVVETREAITLDKEQIRELIISEGLLDVIGEENLYSLIQTAETVTMGYGLAVHCFLLRMKEYPNDQNTAISLTRQDLWNYLDVHLFNEWPLTIREAAVTLSVFEKFTASMAETVLGNNARCIIDDFLSIGSFLTFQAPESYKFIPFFREYLNNKLFEKSTDEYKALYLLAAECYEHNRDYENALFCYKEAKCINRIVELIIYLCENADGCDFARISEKYIREIPEDWEKRDPRILGAKIMLAAYHMRPDEGNCYFAKLKKIAEEEESSIIRNNAIETYVRTLIAYPCGTSNALRENLKEFSSYIQSRGIKLKNIMPTGNMPSLVNGGLDLMSWVNNISVIYPLLKEDCERLMGREAIGAADASIGEIYYEHNELTKAMGSLTKALSEANLKGSFRIQYAVTAIMGRLFIAEDQLNTAVDILDNIRNKALEQNYMEIIPNIDASLAQCALYANDAVMFKKWLDTQAISEHDEFYITYRYQLFIKAKVYTALGRYLEALYVIGLMREYTGSYGRIYFDIDLSILEAIILYRREEEWQEILLDAVIKASEYKLVRIFVDYGSALLPLWKELRANIGNQALSPENKEESISNEAKIDDMYLRSIETELKKMADFYPDYLTMPRRITALTDKEMVVLKLIAKGLNNTQISEELHLNLGTVKFHVKNIMTKLEAKNRTVAVKIAQEEGII